MNHRICLLSIVAMSLAGSNVWADLPEAPACLNIVDSRGRVLGALLDELEYEPFNSSKVAIELRGRIFTVLADTNGIRGGDEGQNYVYFETPDCSGTPLVPIFTIRPGAFLPRTAVAGPNFTLYAQLPDAEEESVTTQSSLFLGEECSSAQETASVVRATKIVDLGTLVQPPLRLDSRRCEP